MVETSTLQAHKTYSRSEELTNFITLAVAALLSIVGLVFLLLKSSKYGGTAIAACAVFGLIYIAVFTVGALCHVLPSGSKWVRMLRRADRSALCLLTVAVFAPILLIGLAGGTKNDAVWAYVLFSLSAAGSVTALALNLINISERKLFCLALYVLVGLACIACIDRIVSICGWDCFRMLLGGFGAYSIGVIVLAIDGIPARNLLRRLFTVCGGALHFVCIYTFLL